MECQICGSDEIEVIYNDYIRNGGIETLTEEKYKMFQCLNCKTIWHENDEEKNVAYYQSKQYREVLEQSTDVENYYRLHDKEVLEKLVYTGTSIYRNASVADIGCGGGSFLDFISGTANKIISIEPSEIYRSSLREKGYEVFAYASDAIKEYGEKVDIVTSFDVIEHVDNPNYFMRDVYELLKDGGIGIIGTPSDCPIMRFLLGKTYEQKLLYSKQHPWILSKKGFEVCCINAGFRKVTIKNKQRYGLGNLISWLQEQKPCGQKTYDFITDTLNTAYKLEIESNGMADYLVAYVEK